MRKKIELAVLVGLLVILVGTLLYSRFGDQWFGTHQAAVPTEEFVSTDHGVRFQYPSLLLLDAIDEEHREIGMFFRAKQDSTKLLTIRRESGLGVLKVLGGGVLDQLRSQVDRRYPDRYPDFSKKSLDDVTIGGQKGFSMHFTYTAKDGSTMHEQLAVVVARDSDGYFLSFQAPEAAFQDVQALFQTVLNSVEFSKPSEEKSPPSSNE